jgi:hypothetical protein
MREIRTSGLMSGEEKRSHRRMPRATALFLDSTAMTVDLTQHLLGIAPEAKSTRDTVRLT